MADLIPIKDANPAELFSTGGLSNLLKAIEKEATTDVHDVKTAKGRKAIASNAMKVAKSKTYIDGLGKEYVGKLKEQTKIIDAERKKARDFLDDLKVRVRKPLTEWEQVEEDRVNALRDRLAQFEVVLPETANSQELAKIISRVESVAVDETWQEYQEQAQKNKDAALFRVGKAYEQVKSAEEAAAKAEKERREKEEKERKEREARIAKEAAEQAKREAEERAKKAKEEAERKERDRIAKIEREKEDLIRREKEAKEREAQAKKEAEEARIRAEERAKLQAQEAANRERQRIAEEKRAEEEAARKREANRKHKAKIHNEALTALKLAGIPEIHAKKAVVTIAAGKVPHCSIEY